MLKQLDQLLQRISPGFHGSMKRSYNRIKKKVHPTLSEIEFRDLLERRLGLEKGDVVFVHSSMRSLYLGFEKSKVLDILKEVVGSEGTLLFPCWHFNIRAEYYIKSHEIVFDAVHSSSAMGKIADVLRKEDTSYRSFHPTNSVVGVGKFARQLLEIHHEGIYPCGEESPFYKMITHHAKIIGLGVTVDNLTFVHTPEDIMRDNFPIKTRMKEIFRCKCINAAGETEFVDTLVASEAIGNRDVCGFFKSHISQKHYRYFKIKGMNFFKLNAHELYSELQGLAEIGKTIYGY